MQAKFFRYIFENAASGVIQSGSIWDSRTDGHIDYMYVAGRNTAVPIFKKMSSTKKLETCSGIAIDFFVLGAYTVPSLEKMMEALEIRGIQTIVLPYISPVDRLMLAYLCHSSGGKYPKIYRFLHNPYDFLQKSGIKNIYFVYGNGRLPEIYPDGNEGVGQMEDGMCFEKQSSDINCIIEDLEGHPYPVYKAGYAVCSGWLFYLGCYGKGLQTIQKFTNKYFREENGMLLKGKLLPKNIWERITKAAPDYFAYFPIVADSTITMYVGPVFRTENRKSRVVGKMFSRDKECSPAICNAEHSCEIKCIYEGDHEVFKGSRHQERIPGTAGILLLGNMDLNSQLTDIVGRYYSVWKGIRCISVPNCGNPGHWNKQLALLFAEKRVHCWICPLISFSSPEMLKDIALTSTYNRIIPINEECGYCVSGLMAPAAEEYNI